MAQNLKFEFDLSYLEEHKDDIDATLAKAISYLNENCDIPDTIFQNNILYNAFMYTGKTLYNFAVDIETLPLEKLAIFMSKLGTHLYKHRYEFKPSEKAKIKQEKLLKYNKLIDILGCMLFSTLVLAKNSNRFYNSFIVNNGLKMFISYLNEENFIKKHLKLTIKDLTEKEFGLVDNFVLNITNLSVKYSDEHAKIWTDLDVVNVLLKIANLHRSSKLHVDISIVNITRRETIGDYINVNAFITCISRLLHRAEHDFNDKDYNRLKRQIYLNGKFLEYDIHSVKDEKGVTISIKVLLECLKKILINDKLKGDAYFGLNIKSCIEAFFLHGNSFEIYFTLELLNELILNETISLDLLDDQSVNDSLNKLLEKDLNEIEDSNEKYICQNVNNFIKKINWYQWHTELKRAVTDY